MATLLKTSYKTLYKCRDCGATNYQPEVARADNGALQPTGKYRCTGCRSIFASVRAWWAPRSPPDFQASRSFS